MLSVFAKTINVQWNLRAFTFFAGRYATTSGRGHIPVAFNSCSVFTKALSPNYNNALTFIDNALPLKKKSQTSSNIALTRNDKALTYRQNPSTN